MNDINNNLSLKYAHLRETLIEQGLFEELDIDEERFSDNLSLFQEILTEEGISQQSINTVIEAIWLAIKLGVRNWDVNVTTQVRAAFEEIKRI
ncbi:hypothetical protein [Limnoraphis robusta]|uniref:Uncharacterized protein n=1 Tax=Limnoraphis robusta CCNP1315 TaxID=3110306 RepID=A0ABU5U6R7_9CYAN|nr:hypothetical protein [Limnoraphis robusta]MEA5522856.1 hypothetical protein [Limnoraphis robusta CCNP1315]MEA5546882.1 hypothetical protein [Limnoraphis robusta CCNP1324]